MEQFDEVCLNYFLKHQSQLFREKVASSLEEAEEFLEDCMAVVCDSLQEVKDYLDESGADISDMSLKDIEEASEVFTLPDGRYLVVEV
ncbi:MAG: glyoxalase [Eubacterium sp.]|nr:glyoxalase [Eubacterium sp.]MCI8917341.1 glyoxalase [Eubacterium sp.]